mmetsp:Transcript_43933/g.82544  ORF Transcript_43933/g.82544 Transcript_43933/m.82544 type:complete len:461 (-) Transcript_43933:10-1392(-)
MPNRLSTPLQHISEMPSLWLHPVHTLEGASPSPLEPHRSRDVSLAGHTLLDMARERIQNYKAALNGSVEPRPSKVSLGGSGFIIHELDEGECCQRHIPLRFSEVAHFQDVSTLLVVGLRGSADQRAVDCACLPLEAVWILGVGSKEPSVYPDAALFSLLTTVGALGAVRSDFTTFYNMEKNPIRAGAFSKVYLSQPRLPADTDSMPKNDEIRKPSKLAVKLFAHNPRKDSASAAMAEAAMLMGSTQHPNISCFQGLFRVPELAVQECECWAMMIEYSSAGDLFHDVSSKGLCGEWRAAEILAGLLSALSHLHARNIVHRDVKSETILLKDPGRPMLFDFESAARLDDAEALRKRRGSPGYCAPEILNSQDYGAKVDVFSAGVVLYFLLTGQLPFSGPTVASTLRRNIRCDVNLELKRLRDVSLLMKTLIMLLLYKEPMVRPEASTALQQVQTVYSNAGGA